MPDSNYLRDLGYSEDEIYGDPDYNEADGMIGGLCAQCANAEGPGSYCYYISGIIDEVSIWNVALTETEIQATMNQHLNDILGGLVSYWKFDEETGQRVEDSSANNYDGYLGTDPNNPDECDPTWVLSDISGNNGWTTGGTKGWTYALRDLGFGYTNLFVEHKSFYV